MPEITSLGGSFIVYLGSSDEFKQLPREMDGFLDNVIVPLHRSPLLPLQLTQGNCPEHHDWRELQLEERLLEVN